MGIKINKVSVSLNGDIDLRKFFAVEESVRAGFSAIKGTVTIDADADKATLDQLKVAVDAHWSVRDVFRACSLIALRVTHRMRPFEHASPVMDALSSIPIEITLVKA
jgi:putative redox protein